MNIVELFSQNLKRIRLEKGFSQEELAEKCGLHRTYISALERKRRNISLGNIQKICTALEVNPEELFKERP